MPIQLILKSQDNIRTYRSSVEKLLLLTQQDTFLTDEEIEKLVQKTQNLIWKYRNFIWDIIPTIPMKVLQPDVVLRNMLGYEVRKFSTLGTYANEGDLIEVAGIIDKPQKKVSISNKFPQPIQHFTLAHELGHALIHRGISQHRDRPLDGTGFFNKKNRQEYQADKFASYFLMPTRQVKLIFKTLFETEKFTIDQNSVFRFGESRVSYFRSIAQDKRGLARILSSTENFGGKVFYSLSHQFGVSKEAMAIRLEELNLVEF